MDNDDNRVQATVNALPVKDEAEEIDFGSFFQYLQSPQGHEVTKRVLSMVEDVKKATVDRRYSNAKFNRWTEVVVIVIVIIAMVVLSVQDKFTPTAGVLLGSVAGYFFGKNK